MVSCTRRAGSRHTPLSKDSHSVPTFSHHFFFFPFVFPPPLLLCPPAPLAPPLSTTPWVAPPPPPPLLLIRACTNVDRSVFFNQRSGSGAGVTPGTTPAGTRRVRTFFGFGFVIFSSADGAFAKGNSEVVGCTGGWDVSRLFVTDIGSWSRTRR